MSTDAVGGAWRYTVELCRGLSARGCTPEVIVFGPQPSGVQQGELAPHAHLVTTPVPLDWLAESPSDHASAASLLAGSASSADIALLHTPAFIGHRPWPVPVTVMMHSCLTTWFASVRGGTAPSDYAWRAAAAADGLRRADAVAAPTRAFAQAVRDAYGLAEVTAIHNGRRPLALPDVPRERAVLTAGRLWDDGKNVAVLDIAAAGLSAPLRAAGSLRHPDGWSVPLCNAHPLGSLDEAGMARAYASAAVFASASRYEPFGLAVLEAAQSGMALVLSDIPSFRELWDGAAVFVPPDDPDAWRAALEATLAAPAPWAARARQRAARYTADACADGTLAFLSRAMAAA